MYSEKTEKLLKKLGAGITDVLFPVSCLGCARNGEWLCGKCLSKIFFKKIEQVCPVCEKALTPDGKTCFSCKKKSPLDGLLICASYQDKLVSKMVHAFKYKFIHDIHLPLGKIMVEKIMSSDLSLPGMIIPVPLHQKRLRWRGFNQAELLGVFLSRELSPGLEIKLPKKLLVRTRNTPSQMKIKDYHERTKNISGAFSASNAGALQGKSILLVDDVVTTGSTIFECAKILKDAGAKEVFAVAVARQSLKNHF